MATQRTISKRKATPAAVDDVPVGPASLCFKSELNLHQKPPIAQNCIRAAEYVEIDPITAIRPDSKVIDFVFPNSADASWDLANLRFRVDFKIQDLQNNDVKDYKAPRETTGPNDGIPASNKYDPVAFSTNALCSLFEKIEASLNDCVINSSDSNHHLKAYIMNSLNYTNSGTRNSILAMAGYHPDGGTHNSTKFRENLGMMVRAQYTKNGAVCSLYGKLVHDLFTIGTVLPVGTKVAFRLHRTRDDIFLMVDPTNPVHLTKGYHVSLIKVQCECLRLRLTPTTISILENQLANQAAAYFFTRMESRVIFIPPNSLQHIAHNIFSGLCPNRIFFGFLPTSSYQGALDQNSFCFNHNNVSSLTLRIDNRIHNKTLTPTWENSCGSLDCYVELLKALRTLNRSLEVEPTLEAYNKGGLTLFGWDLAEDLSEFSTTRMIGNLSLETKFSPKCSSEGLVCYVLASFTSSLFIDRHGGIVLENERRN